MHLPSDTKTDRLFVLVCLYALAAGTVLIAASLLRTPWLSVPLLGTPLGLWFAAIGGGAVAWFAAGRPQFVSSIQTGAPFRKRFFDWIERLTAWQSWTQRPATSGMTSKSDQERTTNERLDEAPLCDRNGLAGALARCALSVVREIPLRIGVTGFDPSSLPARFSSDIDAQFVCFNPPDGLIPQQILKRERLDVWIRVEMINQDSLHFGDVDCANGPGCQPKTVLIQTPQLSDAFETQLDLGEPSGAMLANAFARHIEAGETRLHEFNLRDAQHCRAVFDLSLALAALSRLPHRLTLGDLFLGRKPFTHARAASIIGSLLHHGGGSSVHQACARLVATWFTSIARTDPAGTWVDGVTRASERLRGEPTALLQRGAVLASAERYDEALRAFIDAALAIRHTELATDDDVVQLIQRELTAIQPADELAVGRVAAGITVALASADREVRRYVREDIDEDLEQSTWLVANSDLREFLQSLMQRIQQLPRQLQFLDAA